MRRAWPIALVAPALLLGCVSHTGPAPAQGSASPPASHSPRLTVERLRQAELQRQDGAGIPDGEFPAELTPSQGDVFALGGNMLGEVAAGIPGGAALGFSGHVAGGNNVGKAMGSTLGGLLGAVLGPLGGIFGSMAGGFAGKQIQHAMGDESPVGDDHGPIYIEGMDTGPLVATSPSWTPPPDANET